MAINGQSECHSVYVCEACRDRYFEEIRNKLEVEKYGPNEQ